MKPSFLKKLFLFFVLALVGSLIFFHYKNETLPLIKGYWIWAGVLPASLPSSAPTTLYVYQGVIIKKQGREFFIKKGLSPHSIKASDLYLVFRIEGDLPTPSHVVHLIESFCNDWKKHNVRVSGIQLDFDAPTSKLLVYSSFLKTVRAGLSQFFKLSITGLGDWVVFNTHDLILLSQTTDEIVFQLYQGRSYIPNLNFYLRKLSHLRIPFKVGILSPQLSKKEIDMLKKNPYFKGMLIFLQR